MEIEKLRRLWYLSTVPTHSPASLTELHELVKELVSETLSYENDGRCIFCKNYIFCNPSNCVDRVKIQKHWCNEYYYEMCPKYHDSKCKECSKDYVNFELRMEGD